MTLHAPTAMKLHMLVRARLLVMSCHAGHVVFEPSIADTQAAVLSVLEAAVLAASDLPRITLSGDSVGGIAPPAVSSLAATSGNAGTIPSTKLDEKSVQNVLQVSYPHHCTRCM